MKAKIQMKRTFIAFLCVALMLCVVPMSANAAKEMFTTYEVTSVSITGIDAPKAGDKFDFTAEEVSQKYNIVKVAWRQQYSSKYITSSSSTATTGVVYEVHIVLEVATPDHYFATTGDRLSAVQSVTVNGQAATCSSYVDSELHGIDASKYEYDTTYKRYLTVCYTFPPAQAPEPVESVDFNMPEIKPGERIPTTFQESGMTITTVNGQENHGYINVNTFSWSYQDGTALPANATFEYGKSYTLHMQLQAIYERSFATDPNHFLSQPGKPFTAAKVRINGVSATVLPEYLYGTVDKIVAVSCVFKCDSMSTIDKIDLVNITPPTAGQAPTYTFNIGGSVKGYENNGRNDAYYKNGMCWSEVGSSYVLSDGTQTFLPGKSYQLDVRLKAVDGYVFATNAYGNIDLTATVNGKTATVSGNKNEVLITYAFPATGNIALNKVGVTDVDAPVTGQVPDYEVGFNNANYGPASYQPNTATKKNNVSWYCEEEKRTLSVGEKFKEEKTYTFVVLIDANLGYEFQYTSGKINIAATVNGKNVTDISSGNKEQVCLYYTFPKTAAHKCSPQKVDEVKASCKAVGKNAYYFCTECGKNFEDSKCTKQITDLNSWGVIPKTAHSGGKATCQNRAICRNCGEQYGELGAHNFGSAWDYKDETGHAHKCKVCGTHDAVVPHGGGTAKCGEKAKCEACRAEYGNVQNHQWSKIPEYVNNKGHAYKCTVVGCSEHSDIVKHTPGPAATETNPQTCTDCNYIIAPKLSHVHNLVKKDEEDATCTTSGMESYYYCQSCNAIFSDSKGKHEITDKDSLVIPAAGHKDSKWKTKADVHWKECTNKGCDVITVEKAAHEFDKDGKCTICEYKPKGSNDSTQAADPTDEQDVTDEQDTTLPDDSSEDTDFTTETTDADTTDADTTGVNNTAPGDTDNALTRILAIVFGIIAVAGITVVVIVMIKKNKKKG